MDIFYIANHLSYESHHIIANAIAAGASAIAARATAIAAEDEARGNSSFSSVSRRLKPRETNNP